MVTRGSVIRAYFAGALGTRVWKRSDMSVETVITSGSPVAIVTYGRDYHLLLDALWPFPQTNLNSTDCIVVRSTAASAKAHEP